jgi:hypothetical protein
MPPRADTAARSTSRDHDQSGLGDAAGPSNAPPAAGGLGSAGLRAAARQQQHAAREAAAPRYPEANQEVVGILLRNSDNPWPSALPSEPIACTERQLLLFVPQWGGGLPFSFCDPESPLVRGALACAAKIADFDDPCTTKERQCSCQLTLSYLQPAVGHDLSLSWK